MKILADLGKLKNGRNVIVIQKADRIEYVLAEAYDPNGPENSKWSSGTYLYDLESLAKAILYYNMPIGYDRMTEIASKAIDGLREDDETEAQIYCEEEIEMDSDELEYFGFVESEDEDG